jgi:hypothetical protein
MQSFPSYEKRNQKNESSNGADREMSEQRKIEALRRRKREFLEAGDLSRAMHCGLIADLIEEALKPSPCPEITVRKRKLDPELSLSCQ